MRFYFATLFVCFFSLPNIVKAEEFNLCPLCSRQGEIICPFGYEAACLEKVANQSTPKCIFLGERFVPGCLHFAGIKKLDFDFSNWNLPPGTMIDIIGGGETYTLNREIVGCKKL